MCQWSFIHHVDCHLNKHMHRWDEKQHPAYQFRGGTQLSCGTSHWPQGGHSGAWLSWLFTAQTTHMISGHFSTLGHSEMSRYPSPKLIPLSWYPGTKSCQDSELTKVPVGSACHRGCWSHPHRHKGAPHLQLWITNKSWQCLDLDQSLLVYQASLFSWSHLTRCQGRN